MPLENQQIAKKANRKYHSTDTSRNVVSSQVTKSLYSILSQEFRRSKHVQHCVQRSNHKNITLS